jgi:hypothetical protein
LEHPLPPIIPATPTDSPIPPPIWPGETTTLLLLPDRPGGGIPGFPFLPPIPCCGSSKRPSHLLPPEPLPLPLPPPVVATPEPPAFMLLAVGLAVLFLFLKYRLAGLIFSFSFLRSLRNGARQAPRRRGCQ